MGKIDSRKYFLKFGDDVPAKEVERVRWLKEAEVNGFIRKDQPEPLSWAAENIYGFSVLTKSNNPKDKLDKTLEAFLKQGSL